MCWAIFFIKTLKSIIKTYWCGFTKLFLLDFWSGGTAATFRDDPRRRRIADMIFEKNWEMRFSDSLTLKISVKATVI